MAQHSWYRYGHFKSIARKKYYLCRSSEAIFSVCATYFTMKTCPLSLRVLSIPGQVVPNHRRVIGRTPTRRHQWCVRLSCQKTPFSFSNLWSCQFSSRTPEHWPSWKTVWCSLLWQKCPSSGNYWGNWSSTAEIGDRELLYYETKLKKNPEDKHFDLTMFSVQKLSVRVYFTVYSLNLKDE